MRFDLAILLTAATVIFAATITTTQQPIAAPPKIYAILLGTGYPRPDADRAGPSTAIIIGEKVFLVDAGRGVTMRLAAANLAPKNIRAVFLTHLHSDHIDGLTDVFHTTWQFGRTTPFELYGPTGTQTLADGIMKFYASDIHIRRDLTEKLPPAGAKINLHTVKQGIIYEDVDVRVTAFLVDHAPVEPAFGYRFDQIEKVFNSTENPRIIASIVISGDTHPNENLIRCAKNADVLIHEAYLPQIKAPTDTASDDQPWFTRYHSTAAEAGEDAARANVKVLVLSHLIPHRTGNADAEFQSEAAKSFHGQIIVGHDLTRIDIPSIQRKNDVAPTSDSVGQQQNRWLEKILNQIETIKPGMKRKDVLNVFEVDGGLSTRFQQTFVHKECGIIKVDIRFKAANDERDGTKTDPDDIIESISKPYLAWGMAD